MRVRRWQVMGVVLAVLWLFVRGVALSPARWAAEFLTGLAVGLPVAFVLRRFYNETMNVGGAVRAVPYAVVYFLLFFRELVTANVDVAYRVLSPSMPIEPAVVEVPLRVESDLAITTIANSITLTPGTLTMDYDNETNTLYVHAIAGQNEEAVLAPIRAWEDYALRIFDEESDPTESPPPQPSARATVDAGPEGGDTDEGTEVEQGTRGTETDTQPGGGGETDG